MSALDQVLAANQAMKRLYVSVHELDATSGKPLFPTTRKKVLERFEADFETIQEGLIAAQKALTFVEYAQMEAE